MKKFNTDLVPKPRNYHSFELPNMPLDIEVGCGVGLHPIQYSMKNPNRFLVAIEHTKEKFEKFFRRYQNNNSPKNLLPIHANAISWVTHLVPELSVDNFIFLYPNPNPKPKHFNHRFHGMPFMEQVIKCLKVNGTITIATNEKFYADEACEWMTRHWKLELIENRKYGLDESEKYRTHFEKKYLERNEDCYNLVFKKPSKA
jgi:tRNA G46 methylase TrmB